VTIAGSNFGSTQGTSTLKFNGTTATVTSGNWSATSIHTTVPIGATTGNVVVHASGVDSATNANTLFTVPVTPTITALSPNSGAIGATVVITGTNFGSSQGTSTLKFNGKTATVAAGNWTASSITTTVPAATTTGNVVVTVSGVSSATNANTLHGRSYDMELR
jgi:hypothetical protein